MTTLNVTIPQELLDQQTTLTTTLAEISQKQTELTAQQAEVQTSLRRIDQAIRFLRGEVVVPVVGTTGRKPMSAEARENIRQGLIRSAEAKRAAKVAAPAPTAPESVPEPTPAPATPAKSASSKKGAGK
jgi:uncharacterized membrane protein